VINKLDNIIEVAIAELRSEIKKAKVDTINGWLAFLHPCAVNTRAVYQKISTLTSIQELKKPPLPGGFLLPIRNHEGNM